MAEGVSVLLDIFAIAPSINNLFTAQLVPTISPVSPDSSLGPWQFDPPDVQPGHRASTLCDMSTMSHPLEGGPPHPSFATAILSTDQGKRASRPLPTSTESGQGPPESDTGVTANSPPPTFDRYTSPASQYPTGRNEGWEEAYDRQRDLRWKAKTRQDLEGWRGGKAPPRSSYSKEAVPTNSYYGQPVSGTIGTHLPKEIMRIERDWSDGEVCQFQTVYPLELEGRLTPAKWAIFVDEINAKFVRAYSVKEAVIDNLVAIATWWTSLLWRTSHFEKMLSEIERDIEEFNKSMFNPEGLNVLSPRFNALQFIEIEYY